MRAYVLAVAAPNYGYAQAKSAHEHNRSLQTSLLKYNSFHYLHPASRRSKAPASAQRPAAAPSARRLVVQHVQVAAPLLRDGHVQPPRLDLLVVQVRVYDARRLICCGQHLCAVARTSYLRFPCWARERAAHQQLANVRLHRSVAHAAEHMRCDAPGCSGPGGHVRCGPGILGRRQPGAALPRGAGRGTCAQGLTTVEWPQAWYLASGLRAGEHVATKSWLSTARARCSSSQCAGPVVVLNAPARLQAARVAALRGARKAQCGAHRPPAARMPTAHPGARRAVLDSGLTPKPAGPGPARAWATRLSRGFLLCRLR